MENSGKNFNGILLVLVLKLSCTEEAPSMEEDSSGSIRSDKIPTTSSSDDDSRDEGENAVSGCTPSLDSAKVPVLQD